MNVLYIVIGAGIFLAVAYFTYGKFLAKIIFQLDDTRETPVISINAKLVYLSSAGLCVILVAQKQMIKQGSHVRCHRIRHAA